MQVLVALARRRAEVVSRDDLIAECWGGRVVGDDAINRCIQRIRKLAGERSGFSVATIAGVGYRLEEMAPPIIEAAVPAPTLAVLAFDNLSGDPEMAYFSDGVSEEILDTIARGSNLRVIARSSSFQFRGPDKAVKRVVADLKATHLLDGSVRRSGSKVRIAARLVECASDTTIWSDRFDRELTDVFALQDEIAAAVAEALRTAFARRACPALIDPAVYEMYLRARAIGMGPRPLKGGVEYSCELIREVTVRAPNFADGWANLARLLMRLARTAGPGPAFARRRAEASAAVQTALRLDPSNAEAHQAQLGLLPMGAYEARYDHLRKNLEIAPNAAWTHSDAATFALRTGRIREAAELLGRAVSLDPLDSVSALWRAGVLAALDDPEARSLYLAGRSKWPDHPTWSNALMAYAINRSDWTAFAEAETYAEAHGHFAEAIVRSTRRFGRAVRDNDLGLVDFARRWLTDQLARTGSVPLDDVIGLATLTGEVDEAFDFLDRASFSHIFSEEFDLPGAIPGSIFFGDGRRRLVPDVRFMGLCHKLGLVDYWLKTDRWPDCADEVPYDFRAESRKVAAEGPARHV
jgi:TolB-like protein